MSWVESFLLDTNVLKSVYGYLLLRKESNPANILTRDENEGLDDYQPQYIETHYKIDENGARSLSQFRTERSQTTEK